MNVLRALATILVLAVTCAGLAAPAVAQKDKLSAEFASRQRTLVYEQSQRHLEYGLELRKKGMSAQSAEQIILAAELGRGINPGANQVLWIMRSYDDAFWKRYGSKASPAKILSYEKKAKDLSMTAQKERLALGNWAASRKLEAEAMELYVELLLLTDEPLVFDAKGQIELPAGSIPKESSLKLREKAISINGRLYVRDELLAKLPALKQIFEVSSKEVRVRTTTSLEDAELLHAMCAALVPELVREVGASPTVRLQLFVFAARADFESTLDALELGDHKIVAGVASPWPLVAMVCAQDLTPALLQGVCLHELTHLFMYSTSRTVFPAWYAEGFADSFGGAGTFTWDGAKLTVGGKLPPERLAPLKAPDGLMPLRELLDADQFAQWKRSKEAGLAFYAQSWAFVRYMKTGAGDQFAARFEQWESRCIGQALGFQLGAKRSTERGPASALFLELFEKDLGKLEEGFKVWLKEQ